MQKMISLLQSDDVSVRNIEIRFLKTMLAVQTLTCLYDSLHLPQ